jgi:acyl-CoA synthetase (AMP-forming)/AMP-acid ligase II
MRDDGNSGDELAPGEIGHVCFLGPQTFLGYVNDPEATAKAISRDGFLYTGDLGYKDAAGLHLTGREKWVIKSFGYQIFPGDVEAHICALAEKVANCVVVGVAHEVVSEAPVALVEKKPNAELTPQELDRHARSLPSYMRPRHWILLEVGQLPLNRVAKPDYLRAQQIARQEIASLRARGEWDSGLVKE